MYDPLVEDHLGTHRHYPDSYWFNQAGHNSQHPKPEDDGKLGQDIDCDVAVIGAGYTGLSCAWQLAQQYNMDVCLLEANQLAWGASGRNAGIVLPATGRLAMTDIARRYGEQVMHNFYHENQAAVSLVEQIIEQTTELGFDCQRQQNGFLKLAHKASVMNELEAQAEFLQQQFNTQVSLLSEQELKSQYLDDQNAYGALKYHHGFGVNPLNLAWGLAQLARQAGAKAYCNSSVIHWHQQQSKQVLVTPSAQVTANKVVIATNGYTPKGFHRLIAGRTLPVLSQIIVTEPLTEQQLADCNLLTSNVVMDTRALKYYYRKLPDNRLLFGGRGAISGKHANDPYYPKRLLKVLQSSFPALANLNYQYTWSGWLCVSMDMLPHIGVSSDKQVYYGMGYCGSGLAFSMQLGKRLADKVAGEVLPELPIYQQPLKRFPFARLSRVGQWGYFHYGRFKDAWF